MSRFLSCRVHILMAFDVSSKSLCQYNLPSGAGGSLSSPTPSPMLSVNLESGATMVDEGVSYFFSCVFLDLLMNLHMPTACENRAFKENAI